jgi:hypothetical protein
MERRHRRSEIPQQAVTYFLEALRERHALEAVALSTEEGLFIAGAGAVDLEHLAAVGAASKSKSFEWQGHRLRVSATTVDGVPLVLTAAGGELSGAEAGFERILGW